MRARSGYGPGELVPQPQGVEGKNRDGGVPRPPYSMDYAPYPETFWARVFRRLDEADGANVVMQEDLRNAVDDISVLRQENTNLWEELSVAQSRMDVLQLRMEEMKLRTEINYEEMIKLKREAAEQREAHEVLLGIVRANRLMTDQANDRVDTEHRQMDVLQRQVDEM